MKGRAHRELRRGDCDEVACRGVPPANRRPPLDVFVLSGPRRYPLFASRPCRRRTSRLDGGAQEIVGIRIAQQVSST